MGGCKYLEDRTVGEFEKEGAFFTIFDGHYSEGLGEAMHARDNFWDSTKSIKGFEPEEIMEGIKEGFKRPKRKC